MLYYQPYYKEKWKNKVVLLQNGGGKSISSKKLENDLLQDGLKPKCFTRRELESLISEADSGIYMGESANKASKRDEIKSIIDNLSIVKDDAKATSNVTTAKAARDNNFFYGCQNIQNLKSLIQIPCYRSKILEGLDLNNETIFNDLCLNLDSDLFNDCCKIKFSDVDMKAKPFLQENVVPDYFEESMIDMIIFVKSTKMKTCIFCGKKYRSHSSLIAALDNHYKELHFINCSNQEIIIVDCANKILGNIKKRNSNFLSTIFCDMVPRTVYQAVRIVKIYLSICYTFLNFYWNKLSSKEIVENENTTQYGKLLESYYRLDKEIKESNKKISNIKSFSRFLEEEANSLLDIDGGYSVKAMSENIGIVLYKGSTKSKDKLYDILSESQYKRLCLITLKALIKFGVVNSIILDDPVDSYDDYNKIKTIQYISSILKSKKIKKWYILTNDYESIFLLTECLKCASVIYLPDFSPMFGGSGTFLECECTHNEIKHYLRKNDIFYLTSYFQNGFESLIKRDLMTCAILMTLRNIKEELVMKIGNLIFCDSISVNCPNKKCSAKIKTCIENKQLIDEIEENIEARAEHYSLSSSTLTLGDICSLFHRMDTNKKSAYPHLHRTDITLFEDYRRNAATSEIKNDFTWRTILNYLLKKMTVVSYIKYEFEKRMILKVQSCFSPALVCEVLNKHGLFNKINKAIEINRINKYGLDTFLERCLEIHNKYSAIYNAFDHGLIYQIMPYYSTAPKDIENFWNEVKTL